jgi:hypothetical protein
VFGTYTQVSVPSWSSGSHCAHDLGRQPESIINGPDGALWVGRGSDATVVGLDAGLDANVVSTATVTR